MAQLSQISSIANPHGNTARVGGLAMIGTVGIAGAVAIITITPKTITKS
ncbi:MAG TPA: hypothetical protein VL635_17875 [Trinickia sp.]|jgi:hypothetical protein|nr:hypothetical protein [Trinickia sp.]